MKMRFLMLAIGAALLAALLASSLTSESVRAQGCMDPTGNPIPCPPGGGGGGGGGGNKRPTKTPIPPTATPSPTATTTSAPLDIVNPSDGSTEVGWSGDCSGTFSEITSCVGKLAASCEASKGTYDININKDGSHTLTCTLPAIIEPTSMPLSNPTDDPTKAKEAGCGGSAEGIAQCVGNLVLKCVNAGGQATTTTGENSAQVSCTKDAFLKIDPTPLPFAYPEDNHIGTCNAADGNLSECMDEYQRQCPDGTLVVKVDIYNSIYDFYCVPHKDEGASLPIANPNPGDPTAGDSWEEECSWGTCWISDLSCWMDGGSGYVVEDSVGNTGYHCDLPTKESKSFPPGGWLPWGMGFLGLVIGLLLPAVQKTSRAHTHTVGSANGGIWKSTDPKESNSMPQTREHVLLSNQPAEPPEAGPPLSVSHGGTGTSADDTGGSNLAAGQQPGDPTDAPVKASYDLQKSKKV